VVPIAEDRFLVLAGASFAEPQGGVFPEESNVAYVLEMSKGSVTWTPITISGTPPPSLHGSMCAAFGDGVVADKIISFGGGSHIQCHDAVSLLDLRRLDQNQAEWTLLAGTGRLQPTNPHQGFSHQLDDEAGDEPLPRYAGACVSYKGYLVVMGGSLIHSLLLPVLNLYLRG